MPLRITDTLLGPPRLTDAHIASLFARIDQPDAKDRQFVDRLRYWCKVAGVDDANALSQWLWETDNARAPRWNNDLNPAGIGITGDATIQPFTITNADEAARVMVQAIYAMVKKEWHPGVPMPPGAVSWMNGVWLPKVRDPRYPPNVSQVKDQNIIYSGNRATWAADDAYMGHVQRFNALIPGVPDQQPFTLPTEPEAPPMAKPTIILVAGHRSDNDAGNPNEKQRTPALANAYLAAFRAAGYTVRYVQNEDGDGRPDITSGGLDTVSAKTRTIMQGISGPMVLLDLHFEGAPARGVFAIVPDVTGLVTAIPGGAPSNDTWANNPLDVKLAGVIARKIAAATGLPIRSTTQPGIMSERHTGVGYQGYRLATMAYSAWSRDRAVRLVVEHGSLPTSDISIINQPEFAEKCAAAAVAAVNEVYAVDTPAPQPGPEPEPEPEPQPGEKHELPKGMTVQLARRLFDRYDAPWGTLYAFDLDQAPSQVWLARAKRSMDAGGDWQTGVWPALREVIRRGDGSEVWRWEDGSTYHRKLNAAAA